MKQWKKVLDAATGCGISLTDITEKVRQLV